MRFRREAIRVGEDSELSQRDVTRGKRQNKMEGTFPRYPCVGNQSKQPPPLTPPPKKKKPQQNNKNKQNQQLPSCILMKEDRLPGNHDIRKYHQKIKIRGETRYCCKLSREEPSYYVMHAKEPATYIHILPPVPLGLAFWTLSGTFLQL